MPTQVKQNINDYVYRQVLKKINYCSNARSNSLNDAGYHPDFSPDNIKRLVISPDGALIYYHVQTEHNNSMTQILFDTNSVIRSQSTEDYVPALQALVKPLVCASIQEIIFVIRSSKVSELRLNDKDIDLTILQKNYKGNGDALKSRFKRLARIGLFNGTLEDFMSIDREIKQSGKAVHLYLKYPKLENNSQVKVVNEEWYKQIIGGMTADKYDMNKKDGRLNVYSYKIRDSILKIQENKDFEKYKKEHKENITKEQKDNFNKEFEEYKYTLRCIVRLYNNLKLHHNVLILDNSKCITNPSTYFNITLYNTELYNDKDNKLGINLVEKEKEQSLDNIVKLNIEILKRGKLVAYTKFLDMFFDQLLECKVEEKIYYTAILKTFDRTIVVPPSLNVKEKQLENKFNIVFDGKRYVDSLANLCSLYTLCFIDSRENDAYYDMIKKDTWTKMLK